MHVLMDVCGFEVDPYPSGIISVSHALRGTKFKTEKRKQAFTTIRLLNVRLITLCAVINRNDVSFADFPDPEFSEITNNTVTQQV